MLENNQDEVNETNETPADSVSNSAQILDSLIPDNQGEQGDQAAQGVALVPPSTVDNLAGLLSLIGIGFEFKGFHRAASVWNDGACHDLSAKLVPVFAKYSWGMRLITFLNTGGGIEELALFPVALAMITGTYNAYMADSEAMKPKQAATVADEEIVPGKTYEAGTPLGSTFTVKRQYED